MKRIKRWLRCYKIIALFLGAFISLNVGGGAFADIVTANLQITPTPCKKGDILHFTATVFHNPLVTSLPGTNFYGGVILDNSNHPELNPWHSELEGFKYPYEEETATINFTDTYTVPTRFKGNFICFYVTEGSEMTNKISNRHCIFVKEPLRRKTRIREKTTIQPERMEQQTTE